MTSSYAVKTAMLIRLSKMQMYATNYEGYNYYKQDEGLYIGVNRVVKSIYGYSGCTGRGLCSVCIYFLKDTVKDLHVPGGVKQGLRHSEVRCIFLIVL